MYPHIITIANQKGGVGKTVTAVNLAVGLASSGRSVVLVDFDPQGSATKYIGIQDSEIKLDISDLLLMKADDLTIDRMRDAILFRFGIGVIAGTRRLAVLEAVITEDRDFRLKQVVKKIKADVVIIDSPPSLSFLLRNAVAAATGVIVPMLPETLAIEGLGELLTTISEIETTHKLDIQMMGVLPTMVDTRTSLHVAIMQQMVDLNIIPLYGSYIRRSTSIAGSTAVHKSIFECAPKSIGAEDYRGFVQEVEVQLG